jgi:hypothetical protein
VVNLSSLQPDEYDALLCSADLVMTENNFSAALGKAICAGIPALAWRNTYDELELTNSLHGELCAPIARMLGASPGSVWPWVAYPIWPPAIESRLDVFRDNRILECIVRAELFGGEPSANAFRNTLADEELRAKIICAQRDFVHRASHLPSAAHCLERIASLREALSSGDT